MRHAGFTLIEGLMVIAVLGILLGIGIPMLRPSGAQLAANSVQSAVQQAKFEAIKTNRPLIVHFDANTASVVVRRGNTAAVIDCDVNATTAHRTVELTEYRSVTLDANVTEFAWLPNGQPRQCAGGWLTSDIEVQLTQGARSRTVVVSPGGEVTVQ